MATVAFGGGPTTDQRRAFCSLKEGSQVPGYRGYIPQLKYRVGQTYSNDTSDLYQESGLHKTPQPIGVLQPDTAPVLRSIPRAGGDNKYQESMVPGYSGFVPRLHFQFGNTYKRHCDDCIDEFTSKRDNYKAKTAELIQQAGGYPRLTPISFDPVVRDHLNLYRDTHPLRPILMGDKKGKYEAPIPGYHGFVPRIGPTQIGLGKCYKYRTQIGLNDFGRQQERKYGLQSDFRPSQRGPVPLQHKSVTVDRTPYDQISNEHYSRRIFSKGMIPRYTGYIPQRRFAMGHTFADTTRMLDACTHDSPSYGEFLKTQPRLRPTVPC